MTMSIPTSGTSRTFLVMVAMRSLMTRRNKRGSGKGLMHRLIMQSHMQGRCLFWNFSIQLCRRKQVGKCLRSQRNTTVMHQALQLCQLLLSVVSGFLTPHRRSRLHQDLQASWQGQQTSSLLLPGATTTTTLERLAESLATLLPVHLVLVTLVETLVIKAGTVR